MLWRRCVFALAGLALLVTPQLPLSATTIVPTGLDGLVDRAELIFAGTVVHSEVVVSGDRKFPFTFITFQVEDLLKGATDRQLTLRLPGGTWQGETVHVEGSPEFILGETYLLFVDGNGTAKFPVVGWTQGQLRFARDPLSGQRILVDAQDRQVLGIQGGQWSKAPDSAATATVLSTEGVRIEPVETSLGRAAALPADGVITSLRALIQSRGATSSFVPGRRVESARAIDVPFSFLFQAAPLPETTK